MNPTNPADSREFSRILGSRVDALEAALSALGTDEKNAAKSIRELCAAIARQALESGFPHIYQRAENLRMVEDEVLRQEGNDLIRELRREALMCCEHQNTCVLTSVTPEFARSLREAMRPWHVEVVHLQTREELSKHLRNSIPQCIVFERNRDPMEELSLVANIRASTRSASVPILAFGESAPLVPSAERRALISGIHFIAEPPSCDHAVNWILECVLQHLAEEDAHTLDNKTGLLSGTSFLNRFQELLDEHDMATEPMSLALLRLEGKKHGAEEAEHNAVMQQAVTTLAHLMHNHLRATDVLGRLGFAEFAALFPGENDGGGLCAIQKVVRAFNRETTSDGSNETIVLGGVTRIKPGQTIREALDEGDRCLYRAQQEEGREVVCLNPEPLDGRRHLVLAMAPSCTRDLLAKSFQGNNLDVTLIDNARDTVDFVSKRLGVHITVVDESLDDGAGLEVVRQIRQIPDCSRVGIVVLGSGDSHLQMVNAFELGANAYTGRPISLDGLTRQIRYVLTRGRSVKQRGSHAHRILVVDEDTRSLYLMASALAAHGGFQVLLARDPGDLQQRLQRVTPEFLIMAVRASDVVDSSEHIAPLLDAGSEYPCIVVLDREDENCSRHLSSRLRLKGIITRPLHVLHFAEQVESYLELPASAAGASIIDVRFCRELQRISSLTEEDRPRTRTLRHEKDINWVH